MIVYRNEISINVYCFSSLRTQEKQSSVEVSDRARGNTFENKRKTDRDQNRSITQKKKKIRSNQFDREN